MVTPDRSLPDPAKVRDSQGVQVGSGNDQVNQFIDTYIAQQVVQAPQAGAPGSVVVGLVPRRAPAFQPRPELMDAVAGAGAGVTVVRALTGMRGVGKTQLAAAYARSCIEAHWRLVAWVNAADTAQLLAGLADVAAAVGIGEPAAELESQAVGVRHWLEANGDSCLLVLDNVTDLDDLNDYLPSAGGCQVVITSNQVQATGFGTPVPVGVFSRDEALAFLTERTGRTGDAGARALAEELGWLPLALAQAAAVIAAQHLGYPEYLNRLRATPVQDYLTRTSGEPYPQGVGEAIVLALDAVQGDDPSGLCQSLIGLVALLSEAGVPRPLLYAAGQQGLPRTAGDKVAADPADVDQALGRLAGASLLTFSEDGHLVVGHRLTLRVARERLARDGTLLSQAGTAVQLLQGIASSLGEPWRNRAAARDAVQQITALHEHLSSSIGDHETDLTEHLLSLRAWAVWCLDDLGDSATVAISYGQELITDLTRVLGDTHPDTLASRNNLAFAYQAAGRLDEAIPLFERVLAEHGQVLGGSHANTLSARGNLAYVYQEAGRLDEAIPLHERTLADREVVLGDAHPDTLISRNNLAFAYQAAGRLDEAINLHERTLADLRQVRGDTHPDALTSGSNLAVAYRAAGRLDEAINLHERILAGREQVLGHTHPDTLGSRNNLAFTYHAAGRLGEAIPLYERNLADNEQVLGSAHPHTMGSRTNLAVAYRDAGRLDEATRLDGGLGS